MRIRAATVEDYEHICDLLEQVDRMHRDVHPEVFRECDGPARGREFLEQAIDDPNAGIFVAESESDTDPSRIAGMILLRLREAPDFPIFVPRRVCLIEDVAVSEACRGQGIGRALMQHAEDWARERGADTCELHVWEFNRNAIGFYESLGYGTASRRMWKHLP